MITVRLVTPSDSRDWLRLRGALWPDGSQAEHAEEIGRFFSGTFPRQPRAVLLAQDELSIRAYAEGCLTNCVAYLEGWFVVANARGRGVGAALVSAAEAWARSQGCSEFASDADPENDASVAAHRRLGFADVGLVRCFRKDL